MRLAKATAATDDDTLTANKLIGSVRLFCDLADVPPGPILGHVAGTNSAKTAAAFLAYLRRLLDSDEAGVEKIKAELTDGTPRVEYCPIHGVATCGRCCGSWSPILGRGGKLPRHWRRCPHCGEDQKVVV